MRTIAYKGEGGLRVSTQEKIFWTTISQNFSFFCTKEAITFPFIIVYGKV